MRVIKPTAIAFSLGALLACSTGKSTSMPQGVDPILGLPFNPATTKFETVPKPIYDACGALRNTGFDRKMWVFAEAVMFEPKYFVVGGFFVKQRAARQKSDTWMTDPSGAIVRVTNSQCELVGAARDVFDYPPPELPNSVLQTLAKDAACKYSHEYGGEHQLRNQMRKHKIDISAIESRALKEAFSAKTLPCS